jgi:predicted DNA-binding transcriptional regulator AlpA
VKPKKRADNLVRATEVAEEFGISRVTLWRWERDGLLPRAHRINNRKYYSRIALEELKAAAAKPGGARSTVQAIQHSNIVV